MFDTVINSLQKFGQFSEQEQMLFKNKLKLKNLKKDTFLLKERQVCQAVYFLKEGSCRQFRHADNGDEIILNLFVQNEWFTDYKSLTSQKASDCYIQTYEDCEIFELELKSAHELIIQNPLFFQLGRLLEQQTLNPNDNSPDEKYLNIITSRPEVIQKFPLKFIASFLKITPETLSRIRRRQK